MLLQRNVIFDHLILHRTTSLTKNNWSTFNSALFGAMDDMWDAELQGKEGQFTISYPLDAETFCLLRREVHSRGNWGWYIWNKDDIPDDRELKHVPLPEVMPHKFTKAGTYKDVIYQKWRSKYNNENLLSTQEGREKKRLSRLKNCVPRRKFASRRTTKTGETVNEYGTLVGSCASRLPMQNVVEHQNLMEKMKNLLPTTSREYANELVRLWETNYAGYNGISQDLFLSQFRAESLVAVSQYTYYEAYATKICRLSPTPKEAARKLAFALCQIGGVMADIFAEAGKEKFRPIKPPNLYETCPLISTILEISAFFQESSKLLLFVNVKNVDNVRKELLDQVWRNELCNVIFIIKDQHEGLFTQDRCFGVASQGVPFIWGLSEEEAVFVFATSPDVFGYRPDKERQAKDKRINGVIEFLRRVGLGIRDKTTVTPGQAEIEK